MTPKEYLSQIQFLDTKIKQRIGQIDELKSTLYGLSGGNGLGEKVSGGANNEAPFVKLIEKLQTMEAELNTLVDNYVDKKNKIIGEIQSLENENYINLLYKRYVEGKRLEVIAVEMNYSYRQVKRFHGWALLEFESKFLKDVPQCPF